MSKIIQFLREVRQVFNSISWGKKEALIQLTIVVISISVATSLILGGFDLLFTNSFNLLTTFKKQTPAVQVNPPIATPSATTNLPTIPNIK